MSKCLSLSVLQLLTLALAVDTVEHPRSSLLTVMLYKLSSIYYTMYFVPTRQMTCFTFFLKLLALDVGLKVI